ncbi:MAG: cytochrome c oxidase accessory protein CcoG [Planctomycetes bacterium]|nr:cytochrome c oxidase accessory protein CcoG [Planctomycetota bacterium]
MRPRISTGRFLTGRRVVAYSLMVVFTGLPYVSVNGMPLILLDVPNRAFTFFGKTFLPTDTLLLAFLLLAVFIGIFLITALFGRLWCGWACPQTVYMEFLYRPIERLFEGRHYRSGGRAQLPPWRRLAKYGVYLVLSMFLAHTFLAYFVGVDTLFQWVRGSPAEHPTAFVVMAATTGLMMFDFCYFREQVCTLMCPYGRFQSVLLDRQSLIIGYDPGRGEPRGKLKKRSDDLVTGTTERGDCIDCHLCVVTCPTGIDIRDGLQMECVGCAQCIDACDEVMDRIKRPRGLIRHSSQAAMETGRRRVLRPRVVIYPVLLVIVLTLFGVTLAGKAEADVDFLRTRSRPYVVLDSGQVSAQVLVKITNRTQEPRRYEIDVPEAEEATSPDLPLTVDGGEASTATVRLVLARERFHQGRAPISVRVSDDNGFTAAFDHHVLGPLFGGEGGS